MSEFPQGAHDAWLAGYHRDQTEVWCSNPRCDLHLSGTTVTTHTENGQSWCEPEECECNHRWLYDRPAEQEEADDDQ